MHEFYQRMLTACMLLIAVGLVFFYTPALIFSISWGIILIYLYCVEMPHIFINSYMRLIGLVYPILPASTMIFLNQSPERNLIILLILAVSAADVGGYITGKLWGRHKLVPFISPKKTWEGLLGGFACCLATLSIIQYTTCAQLTITRIVPVAIGITVISLAGDLFESLLKRVARIKDSGTLLPGHGGLLDRIDGLLFVTPFFWILRVWLSQLFCL